MSDKIYSTTEMLNWAQELLTDIAEDVHAKYLELDTNPDRSEEDILMADGLLIAEGIIARYKKILRLMS